MKVLVIITPRRRLRHHNLIQPACPTPTATAICGISFAPCSTPTSTAWQQRKATRFEGGRAEGTAVAEADIAGAATSGGILGVCGDAFNAFAGYVTGGVDFGVVAYVAGACGVVSL